jgi:hypothetical protein
MIPWVDDMIDILKQTRCPNDWCNEVAVVKCTNPNSNSLPETLLQQCPNRLFGKGSINEYQQETVLMIIVCPTSFWIS